MVDTPRSIDVDGVIAEEANELVDVGPRKAGKEFPYH
jgi:hypothetical protein